MHASSAVSLDDVPVEQALAELQTELQNIVNQG
jgi:hypothetical protein